MTQRVFNFSSGPAVLPEPVLAEAQRDLMALPGVGASILEISHRSPTFENIIQQAETNVRQLLAIPDDYAVLFLQGGGRLMFSMIPMNLMGGGRRLSNYLITGSWSKYAAQEAVKFGEAQVVWDGKATNYDRLPASSGFAFGSEGGVFVLRVERNDSGRAVCHGAGSGRRSASVRCVERFLEPAGGHTEVWSLLRLRTKKCRSGWLDGRCYSQGVVGSKQRVTAGLSEFSDSRGSTVAMEYGPDVSDLHFDAGDEVASSPTLAGWRRWRPRIGPKPSYCTM